MESIVIGTAGHIDHGKTALVKALTGTDTDTLEEEKRRGITINLGFAYMPLPCGKTAGFVDVPGHERLIKNMLAGAGGVDVAMIIIAANEGIMPQTREHISILSYLDIQESLVVLTKIAVAEPDFKDLVREDIREYLAGTYLQNAPVIEVDSLSGQGIPRLVEELDRIAQRVSRRGLAQPPRLSVDRTFSIKGFGTVVTGTLTEGVLRAGDEITVYPQDIKAKIRGLQVHGEPVERSSAGQRTAVNIAGVALDQLRRGCVLAERGSVITTDVVDVRVSMLTGRCPVLKRKDQLKMYTGACEAVASIVPLEGARIQPGAQTYAQLRLQEPLVIRNRDRFILRSISPAITVGGGHIVDPAPAPYRKIRPAMLESAQAKDSEDVETALAQFAEEHPFLGAAGLCRLVNRPVPGGLLRALVDNGTFLETAGLYIHSQTLAGCHARLSELLSRYHAENPCEDGCPRPELCSRFGLLELKHFDLLLALLTARGAVLERQGRFSLPGFSPAGDARIAARKEKMLARVEAAAYSMLTIDELTGGEALARQTLPALLRAECVLIDGRYVLSRPLYEAAKKVVAELCAAYTVARLSDFRTRIGTSRKFALVILEQFDRERYTVQRGVDRVICSA